MTSILLKSSIFMLLRNSQGIHYISEVSEASYACGKCPTKWFSRPFDEARLLVTAQNLLPKRPNAPFYVLVHCTISSCQRGGSFWQLLLWCKLCHTKRSTSPSCCRDLRSNLRSF